MKQRMTITLSAIAIVFAVVAIPLVDPLSTRAQESVAEEEESISPSVDNERSRKMNEKLRKVTEKVPEKAVLHPEDGPQPAKGAAAIAIQDGGILIEEVEEEEVGAAATAIPDRGNPFVPGAMPGEDPFGEVQTTPFHVEIARSVKLIHNAAEALRDADNEEAKTKAQQHLTQLIEQYFDREMQRREAELAKIEERVRKLREQLDLRRDKKQEIIDLQIQVAVNEAEGLGFFSQPAERGGRGPLAPAAPLPFEQPTRPADDPF